MRAMDKGTSVIALKSTCDLSNDSQCIPRACLSAQRIAACKCDAPNPITQFPGRIQRTNRLGIAEHLFENRHEITYDRVPRNFHSGLSQSNPRMDLDQQEASSFCLFQDLGYLAHTSGEVSPAPQALNFDLNPR